MDEELKEKLFRHLIDEFEKASESGESAMRAGIDYSAINKSFGIVLGDESYLLPANYVDDHPEAGGSLTERIKSWANGGVAG